MGKHVSIEIKIISIFHTAPEPCYKDTEYRCEYDELFCIDESLVCNGVIDCPNEDDEDNCEDGM